MEQGEKKYLEERFKSIQKELQAAKEMDASKHLELSNYFSEIKEQLSQLHSEQKKTNGRVRDLEKMTFAAQMLQKRPALFLMLLFLIAFLVDIFTNEQVISLLKGLI